MIRPCLSALMTSHVVIVILSALLSLNSPAQKMTQADAAAQLGVPHTQLTQVEIQKLYFEALDLTVTCYKAIDLRTQETVSVVVDAAGDEYDLSALRVADNAARLGSPTAKIEAQLRKATREHPQTKKLVGVWLRFDATPIMEFSHSRMIGAQGPEVSMEKQRELESSVTTFAMDRNLEVTSPMEAIMREAGMDVRHVSSTAPVILAELNSAEVAQLSQSPFVDRLYLCTEVFEDHNLQSLRTHRTDRVHEYGVTGRGVRVAMNEDNGIDPAHPWLNVTAWFNSGTPNPDEHIQGTSGCVASQLQTRLGSAPDVDLYSANAASYSYTDVVAALDWVATSNIDVTNMSWGSNQAGVLRMIDRYIDYQSRIYQDSYVVSAGNSGLSNHVNSPAQAWNAVAVGGLNSYSDPDWTGDDMYTSSSAVNPATGCEKPNLVASAVNVDTLGGSANSWLHDNYSGTSFSAPFATANLANTMQINSTVVASPEAAMATLMATAWHNIEGSTRLSGQDGAGGLHGLAAYRCGQYSRISSVTLTASSFSTNGYYVRDIYLVAGDRTRVCIGWSALADSSYSTTVLNADLDLAILAGSGSTSGTAYGFSSSVNNNFEIVEFTPPYTGTYTIRVNDYRFDGTSERVGFAWSQKWADTSYARLREYTSETVPTAGPTIGNGFYWMDVDAPGSPSAPFVAFPSATFSGTALASDLWFPLGIDIWTEFWLDTLNQPGALWTGSVGTTSTTGSNFAYRLNIPFEPSVVGFPMHHMFFTGEVGAGYPMDIKEISEVHTINFWPQGTVHQLSDDGSFALALPFNFPYYGTTHIAVGVNANGSLTLGGLDSDYTETQAEFLGNGARIAACWDDLKPDIDGAEGPPIIRTRVVNQGEKKVIIEFINVGEYATSTTATGANTFRYILYESGRIDIEFRDMDLQDCITGISPGTNISSANPIDLSKHGRFSNSGALYEVFDSSNVFDLAGPTGGYFDRVSFIPVNASASVYRVDLFDTRF